MISTITQNDLDLHAKWQRGSPDGVRIITAFQADLSGADLRGANLSGADLSRADLSMANLSRANLSRADLSMANLSMANLRGADLSGADLRGCDLSGANLRGCDLSGANLRGANLSRADLSMANLSRADLSMANLSRADLSRANLSRANLSMANLSMANLRGADLRGCDLSEANLSRAKNIPDYVAAVTSIVADGDLIGWKKLRGGLIAKLQITADARRSNATGRKCRAERAVVLNIFDGDNEAGKGVSKYDEDFVYRTGETVSVSDFDEDRWNECSSGIHFFITRYEAENY